MAISVVQKYLNLALSLVVSNKSGTDTFFQLPDDWRRLSSLKVKDPHLDSYTQGIDSVKSINKADTDNSAFFVFFSHPVSVTYVNGVSLSNIFNTSFYGIYRDRAGKINSPGSSTNIITFNNNLSTSSGYTTVYDSSNPGADVDVFIVELEFE